MSRAGTLVALFTITPILVAIPSLAVLLQDPGYETVEVRPNVHVIRGAGANTTILQGEKGIFVVDTKLGTHTAALRDAIEKISPRRVRYLVNTHAHLENCGGNRDFPTKPSVIAHDACDTRMRENGLQGADMCFSQRFKLKLGSEVVTCHHKGIGHSDGDIIIHFERSQVLVVGGLIANGAHPAILPEHGCDIFRWLDVLRGIRETFDPIGLTIIPGDGAPGGMDLVSDQITYLEDMLDTMRAAHRHGLSRKEAIALSKDLRRKYADFKGPHFEASLGTVYDLLSGH